MSRARPAVVVAADRRDGPTALQGDDLFGVITAIDHITGANNLVGADGDEVGEGCLEGAQIGVEVGAPAIDPGGPPRPVM